jgi:hypothetical protein
VNCPASDACHDGECFISDGTYACRNVLKPVYRNVCTTCSIDPITSDVIEIPCEENEFPVCYKHECDSSTGLCTRRVPRFDVATINCTQQFCDETGNGVIITRELCRETPCAEVSCKEDGVSCEFTPREGGSKNCPYRQCQVAECDESFQCIYQPLDCSDVTHDRCKVYAPVENEDQTDCKCELIDDREETKCDKGSCEVALCLNGTPEDCQNYCNPLTGDCDIVDLVCLNSTIPYENRECYEEKCVDGECLPFRIENATIDNCGNCLANPDFPPVDCIFADDDITSFLAGLGSAIIAIVITAVVVALLIGFIGGRKVYDIVTAARATDISATSTNPLYQEEARGGDNPLHG